MNTKPLYFEELFERVLGILRVDEMAEIELMVVDGRDTMTSESLTG